MKEMNSAECTNCGTGTKRPLFYQEKPYCFKCFGLLTTGQITPPSEITETVIKCAYCGYLNKDKEAKFCQNCGLALLGDEIPVEKGNVFQPEGPVSAELSFNTRLPDNFDEINRSPVYTRPVQTKYITRVTFYRNEKKMVKGITQMESSGWEVVSTETVQQGYAAGKTCLLGCLFLPLALLGKKDNHFKVVYRRPA